VDRVLAALAPPSVLASTLAIPTLPAAVAAVNVVAFTAATPVAKVPPIVTAVAPVCLVSEIRHRRGAVVVPEVGLEWGRIVLDPTRP
jgi:hypothetical protein